MEMAKYFLVVDLSFEWFASEKPIILI